MSLDAISNPDYDNTPLEPQVGRFQDIASCDKQNSPETMEDWNKLLEDTRQKVEGLKEQILTEEQKEVLRNIYCNLPEKQEYKDGEQLNSHDTLRIAIEKQTLKLIKPEGLNLYVISLNGNVDYFYNEDGSIYGNFKSFSEKYSQMIINDLAEFYGAETSISDSGEISININGIAVPPLSDKYILMMHSSLESTIRFLETLEEVSTLNEKEFLGRVYHSIGDKYPKLKKSIENQEIKILPISGSDHYGVSINGESIDYIFSHDGELLANIIGNITGDNLDLFKLDAQKEGFILDIDKNGHMYFISQKEGLRIGQGMPEFYTIFIKIQKEINKGYEVLKMLLKEKGVTEW